MRDQAWSILNLDLAAGPQTVPSSDRPVLAVFWWRGLPLGQKALLAQETGLTADQVLAAAAPMIADQLAARQAFECLPRAGVDGAPHHRLSLSEAGSIDPLAALDAATASRPAAQRDLAVIVCTRDRLSMLAKCLASLSTQSRPPAQIVVVDNSAGGTARELCLAEHPQVTYVHEPRPGLSVARNAGVAVARAELVAFTDDDVELPPDWAEEMARAFHDPAVDAVTGLVLPAELATPAQRAFELDMGGFTSRFIPLVFDGGFLQETAAMGPQVWRIGAGANMAFRRSVFARLGGFDERLGAGASGCSEDSEYWYRILAAGGACLYEPRVVVRHHHRADWRGLRRQIRAYMRGHLAALVAQADRYGHSGNIRRIFRQLPVYFVRSGMMALQNLAWWRLALLGHEVAGWTLGLQYLVRPGWRRSGAPRAPSTSAAAAAPQGAMRHA